MRRNSPFFWLALAAYLIVACPLMSQAVDPDSSVILYKYDGTSLRDSRWGKIAIFQQALSDSLKACGKDGIAVDGWFGSGTRKGINRLLSCPGFEDLQVPVGHRLYGAIHVLLWQRLLPGVALPTVHQRAFCLSLSHEGTDYDRVEWNFDTADDKSILTWGPFGATIGWGNEVAGILRRLNATNNDLLKDIFGSAFFDDDSSVVSQLLAIGEQNRSRQRTRIYRLMRAVYDSVPNRIDFKKRLQRLGATPAGRAAYDWYAFESNDWLKPNFKRLYRLIPNADSTATEIDYAFFLDLGMHAGITTRRIAAAKTAIREKEAELNRPLVPAERRRVISRVFVEAINQQWRHDRMGRNVVFYIDYFKPEKLTAEELSAWRNRTGRKASSFGLSDARKYYPPFLKAE